MKNEDIVNSLKVAHESLLKGEIKSGRMQIGILLGILERDQVNVRLSLPDNIIKMLIKEVFASWGENGVSFGLSEDEAKELEKYLIDNKLGGYEA